MKRILLLSVLGLTSASLLSCTSIQQALSPTAEYQSYSCSSLKAEQKRLLEKREYIVQKHRNDVMSQASHAAGVFKDLIGGAASPVPTDALGSQSPHQRELDRIEKRYDAVSRVMVAKDCK